MPFPHIEEDDCPEHTPSIKVSGHKQCYMHNQGIVNPTPPKHLCSHNAASEGKHGVTVCLAVDATKHTPFALCLVAFTKGQGQEECANLQTPNTEMHPEDSSACHSVITLNT